MKRQLFTFVSRLWRDAFLLLVLSTKMVFAQIELVKDINTDVAMSNEFEDMLEVNNILYFNATHALWRTDGSIGEGVEIKKFVSLGPLQDLNGSVVFAADDGASGVELWKSDGTLSGTVLIRDINPGANSSWPELLTIVGDQIFFVSTNDKGKELWRTDGTSGGTIMVEDIFRGPESSNPTKLIEHNNKLFFVASTKKNGTELWSSDGTRGGTRIVKDIFKGSGNSNPSNLTVAGSWLYFSAETEEHGNELWTTNGLPAGTKLIQDVFPGPESSYPSWLIDKSGILFFVADDGIHGSEFWRSNGTAAGTELSFDLTPGTEGSFGEHPYGVYYGYVGFDVEVANEKLYFVHVNWLYETNGTIEGTRRLVQTGLGGLYYYGTQLYVFNNEIYYFYFDGDNSEYGHNFDLVKVENSTAKIVKHLGRGQGYAISLYVASSSMFFPFGVDLNYMLWRSDGTTEATYPIQDVLGGTHGSYPRELVAYKSMVLFEANGGGSVFERGLWSSDGTPQGTVLLRSGDSNNLTLSGDFVYFFSDGYLWKSDGTVDGTSSLVNVSRWTEDLVDVGGTLFFGSDGLWKTDGSLNSTTPVNLSVTPSNMYNYNGTLFFSSGSLWKSDGTESGTIEVKPAPTDPQIYEPWGFANGSNHLFFLSNDNAIGQLLWSIDGVTEKLGLLKDLNRHFVFDIRSGSHGIFYQILGDDEQSGLWSCDGSEPVRIVANANGLHMLEMYNGYMYFAAYDGSSSSVELWRTDGTVPGTTKVKSLLNMGSSGALDAVVMNDILYITGTPYNLWRSDGSEAGTFKVGSAKTVTAAYYLVSTQDILFFKADNFEVGTELFKLNATDAPATVAAVKGPPASDELETESRMAAHPNPFVHEFSFRMTTSQDEEMTLFILDLNGKPILISHDLRTNHDYVLGKELRKGLYILKVLAGKKMYMSRLLKIQ